MKKTIALLLSVLMMMSLFTVASADELSPVTYYMEYNEDGTATLVFQAGDLAAFDFGVIYNPDELTVTEYNYSDEFFELATDDEYTSVYVKNDKAVDNVGNSTYVVFTGAIMYTDDGDSVGFAEKDLASVTFSNISEGDEIAVVMGTAQVEDVKNAQLVGAVDLYKQIEIDSSSLLEGAVKEPKKEMANGESSDMTWLYGVIIGAIIVAAVIIIIISNKNKLDVKVKDVIEEDDEE